MNNDEKTITKTTVEIILPFIYRQIIPTNPEMNKCAEIR
jgi:hypothetical protein